MNAYYNEINKYCAAWLRNLIAAGHIAAGDVDERDIRDVRPDDLRGYTQCHFFAGIGGWPLALRLAGWPDDRSVWSGSAPCQPFSQAGAGLGFADERHLWPDFYWLIAQCRPSDVIGEQVASKDVDDWIDLVQANMEALDYAFGSVPFPSAGIGAPHIRDRNFWMAHADSSGRKARQRNIRTRQSDDAGSRKAGILAHDHDHDHDHDHGRAAQAGSRLLDIEHNAQSRSGACIVADTDRGQCNGIADIRRTEPYGENAGRTQGRGESESHGAVCELADSDIGPSPQGRALDGGRHSRSDAITRAGFGGDGMPDGFERIEAAGPTNGFWRDADWLLCRDEKWRPVEPGTFPLVDGLPAGMGKLRPEQRRLAEMAGLDAASLKRAKAYRTGTLRGYGNAINVEAAAAFIRAADEALKS